MSTATNLPGPVAAAMLRDLGATVVKVEPPSGDPLAQVAPDWYSDLCARVDVLRLDLKTGDGRSRLAELLASADLLITASRPASLQRLGLSWPELHARHPRLCQVAIVGHGAPRQDIVGHDLTYQAAAGLISEPPMMPRILVADLAGAQRAVVAALGLLLARERNGATGCVEVALAESAALFAEPLRHGLTSSIGPLGGAWAPYSIYSTRDGWLAVAAIEPHFRAALARELLVDVEDRAALTRVLAERSAIEWERWAEARGLPMAALREPRSREA